MNDIISVIIPVYNSESYLERCLESVTSQTYQNLEIIVVNDGSEDQSAKIIDLWAQKDQRIIPIHQKNQGVSSARNQGLKIAKGDCIGFVDADDEVEKDLYEFLYHNLQKYDADISHCGFELVKPDKTVKFHNTGIILIQNKYEAIAEILSGQRVEPGVWNKLYKKTMLQNVVFPEDIKINEDLLFNIDAFKNAEKSVFEDVIKYRYFFISTSVSRSSYTLEKLQNLSFVADQVFQNLMDLPLKKEVGKFYVSKQLEVLKIHQSNALNNVNFTGEVRQKIKNVNSTGMGRRIWFLKKTLLDYPFIYKIARFIYEVLFERNLKWKNN